ncbi:YndJ family protein [Solibacillus sp. FSL H8-0538]|uniref:YndJ family protein n=1 Tax=Solibacillus sp. FSL H8-0538 TaxID=2921400 RepID=UPI0030F5C355
MQDNLRKNLCNGLTLLGCILLILCYFFNTGPRYVLYLTVAQLLFVPTVLQCVVTVKLYEKVIIAAGMVAITGMMIWPNGLFTIICAGVYVLSTLIIALIGIKRFLRRGFTNIAEITIDVAFVYMLIGGLWFFAYTAGIDTGFSPIITWLTAIHFHYSGFLLNVSVGLFGRISQSKWYMPVAILMMAGLPLVAVGITFSRIIEIVSVLLYIVAIYTLLILTLRTHLSRVQGFCLRLSIVALCVSILWSLLYAFGNLNGMHIVSIPDMLAFHGWINCIFFGVLTMLAWAIQTPETTQRPFDFPVSQIRGKLPLSKKTNLGLVDRLSDYCETGNLPKSIAHFYEQTNSYTLHASVQWHKWFKLFAFIYKGISNIIKQINLPLGRQRVEMTGVMVAVDAAIDGRSTPRAWIRKIGDETVFTAIYSQHTSDKTYMNIALPLPFSAMTGILSLYEEDGKLHLTSNASGDAGTYLAFKKAVFKLPIHEHFIIEEQSPIHLTAVHKMHIFGIPFLHIDYEIFREA